MDEAARTMTIQSRSLTMKLIAGTVVFVALTGCSKPNESAQATAAPADSTTTSQPVSVSPEASNEVLARFKQEIWPAIDAYNQNPFQGSPEAGRLSAVIDKGLAATEWSRVRDGVQRLGHLGPASAAEGQLTLVGTSVAAITQSNTPTATLEVCYTYTLATDSNDPPSTKRESAASEATVELRKTDNWYLYGITNDHVVPGCSSSKA